MCGRYTLTDLQFLKESQPEIYKKVMDKKNGIAQAPRFNVSPMARMPIVAVREGEPKPLTAMWWLVPHWSKDGKPDPKYPSFNARSETLEQLKTFAPLFKSRRCLIPANGFYEWMKVPVETEVKGKKKEIIEKHPIHIKLKKEDGFMFAGLFSIWRNDKEEEFPSFTIITTTPNKLMAPIHNRMPVILPEKVYEQWLDPEFNDTEILKKFLTPYPDKEMTTYRVSTYVSSGRNEGEECIKPYEEN